MPRCLQLKFALHFNDSKTTSLQAHGVLGHLRESKIPL
jgi:hypothetical protein